MKIFKNNKAFSLVELLVVILIVGILSGVSYVAIQKAKVRALNEKMLDDLVAIANALEDYKRDHLGKFPIPEPGSNQNVNCYYADATYAHDCDAGVFRQGMVDNSLLGKRYLREVPTDPHTDSRYVYGVTNDGKYFQLAGLWEDGGTYTARTVENLARGFELPSITRAFDGPNFVVNKGTYLPYSPDQLVLTGTLDNINGVPQVNGQPASNGTLLVETDVVTTNGFSSADIFFSDGSVTHIDPDSELVMKDMTVDKNDKTGTVTKILLKLNLGKIWNKVVRLADNSEFRVETNGAIAGVRGSEFGIEDDDSVTVKDGEVWQHDKSDLPGAGIDVDDTPIELVLAVPEPDPVDPDAPYVEEATDPNDYLEYYDVDLPLHSGMRPHILGIQSGEIRVRNINHFVEQVNAEQGFNRKVQVSRIAAYDEPFLGLDGGETPLFVSDPIGTQIQGPHTIDISGLSGETTLYLRFEYIESSVITRASSFTLNPLTITAGTNLSQFDLYPQQFTDPPELLVNVPGFVPLPAGGATAQFPLNFNVINYDDPVTYIITATGGCNVLDSDPITAGPVAVEAAVEGVCNFTIDAQLQNDESLFNDDIQVQIVAGTSQLFINKPSPGAQLIQGQSIDLEWQAPNAPSGVSFNVDVTGPTPFAQSDAGTSFKLTPPFDEGLYTWVVTMFASDNTELETKTSTFEVVSDVVVDFNCFPGSGTTSSDCSVVTPDSNTTAAVDLTLQPLTFDPNFDYDWDTTHPDVTIDPPLTGGDVEVEVLLPDPFDAPFDVTFNLSVSNPNAGASGSFVGSQTYTYQFQPLPEETIVDIGFNLTNVDLSGETAGNTIDLFTILEGNLDATLDTSAIVPISINNCDVQDETANAVSLTDYIVDTDETLTCHLAAGNVVEGYNVPSSLQASIDIIAPVVVTETRVTGIAFVDDLIPGFNVLTNIAPPQPFPDKVAIIEADDTPLSTLTIDEGVTGFCDYFVYSPPTATSPQNGTPYSSITEAIGEMNPGLNRLKCHLREAVFSSPIYSLDIDLDANVEIEIQPPPPIFQALNPHPYYALGASIPFDVQHFDPEPVTVSGPDGSWTGGVFVANAPGQYTITPNSPTGGPTIPPEVINVCGFVGISGVEGGGECWMLGAEGDSCDTACTGIGLSCEEGSWDTETNPEVCNVFASSVGTSAKNAYAPFINNQSECVTRDTGDFPDQDCSAEPVTGPFTFERICKCQ